MNFRITGLFYRHTHGVNDSKQSQTQQRPHDSNRTQKKKMFPLRPFKINLTYGFVIVEACVCVFERTLILQF